MATNDRSTEVASFTCFRDATSTCLRDLLMEIRIVDGEA
jgi:hypothetical protein